MWKKIRRIRFDPQGVIRFKLQFIHIQTEREKLQPNQENAEEGIKEWIEENETLNNETVR